MPLMVPKVVEIPAGIRCRNPLGNQTVTRSCTVHVIRYAGEDARGLVARMERSCGPVAYDQDSVAEMLAVKIRPKNIPPIVSPFKMTVSETMAACVVNASGATGAFYNGMICSDLPVLSRASEEAFDAVFAWHEIGHSIHGTIHETPWTRYASESWCDILGCAVALASGHVPEDIMLYAESRRLGCAARGSHDRIPARMSMASEIERVLTPVHYATASACEAVVDRWHRVPWGTDMAELLEVCDLIQASTLRGAREVDADAAATLDRWFYREGRCLRPLNDRHSKVDLGRVDCTGVDADELAVEMLQHMTAGREIVRPRQDLIGGAIAFEAWQATQGRRDLECPLTTLLNELDARKATSAPKMQ